MPNGWVVHDLGSKNGTFVNGERACGSAELAHGDFVQFGSVPFYFLDSADACAVKDGRTILTASALDCRFRPRLLRKPNGEQELQLAEVSGHGVLRFRNEPAEEWSEINLAPLEFALLRVLAEQRRTASLEVEANVMTRELAARLPFRSEYANEENVRQIVKRLRLALRQHGITDLIGSLRRRGYSLTWCVERDRPAREHGSPARSAL